MKLNKDLYLKIWMFVVYFVGFAMLVWVDWRLFFAMVLLLWGHSLERHKHDNALDALAQGMQEVTRDR